ncbi:MAG: hypothetical protein AAF692_04695 [Pseudomonadota bacterium]
MLTLARNTNSWQLILADLALILFLVSAAALTSGRGVEGLEEQTIAQEDAVTPHSLAPAQALYRAGPGLPSLAEWLERQPRDPRATLTIVAQHTDGKEEDAWSQARRMAATASALGVRSRVVIQEGSSDAVHASLGYDQPAL